MTELEKEFSVKGFAIAMRRLNKKYYDDPEEMHYYADMLMCELLTELGYNEGVEIFKEMPKWYS